MTQEWKHVRNTVLKAHVELHSSQKDNFIAVFFKMDSVYTESIFSFYTPKRKSLWQMFFDTHFKKHNKCYRRKICIYNILKFSRVFFLRSAKKVKKIKYFTISGYEQSCLLTEYCGDRVLYHDIYMFPISIPYIESKLPK